MIVIGGACDDFTYDTLNRVFRRLMDGAALVGMHRNLYWRTAKAGELDGGAFLAGLEEAAGVARRRSAASRRPRTSPRASSCWACAAARADGGRRHRERRDRRTGRRPPRRCWCAPGSSATSDLGKGTPDRRDRRARRPPRAPRRDLDGESPTVARRPRIFGGIAPQYSWMGAVLSFGQDGRWRRAMVANVNGIPARGCWTWPRERGSFPGNWRRAGWHVVSLDANEPMLRAGLPANDGPSLNGRISPILGRAEALPFPDESFDAVTFTYLLRYVDEPGAVVRNSPACSARVGRSRRSSSTSPRAAAARWLARLHARRHAGRRGGRLARLVPHGAVPRARASSAS